MIKILLKCILQPHIRLMILTLVLLGINKSTYASNAAVEEVVLQNQTLEVVGVIRDANGMPLPGANVMERGSRNGTQTDFEGEFSLEVASENAVLVISFLGFATQEIALDGESEIEITLEEDNAALDEVVVIGYGTQKRRDLTGAVTSIDLSNDIQVQPNVSIAQTLQGSVPGLNIGQVNSAGEEPNLSIRGRTSLSGAQNPLIVLDGVIFRGNLIDINPNDIKSIDVLKDNSATAVYGSQAANGVLIITTKSSGKVGEGPTISYSAKYSFQSPHKELRPGGADHFIEKIGESRWRESRTEESGYIEPNPDWDVSSLFKTNEQAENYLAGRETNWYDLLTNDNIFVNDHSLSLSNKTESTNYFVSLGYTDQAGFMINEQYERLNARVNIDSDITDWLTMGVQTFLSTSDYSGYSPSASSKYLTPFDAAFDENGDYVKLIENSYVSPLIATQTDNKDIRQSLFGNIYAKIDFPFLDGLSYRVNASHTQITNRYYTFEPYANNFQGFGSKSFRNNNNFALDNRLTYTQRFNDHNLDVTLVYGIEERDEDFQRGTAQNFINDVLGYNALQYGDAELQTVQSEAWEESSLFTMGRIFYSFKDKYLFTGTVRRDGFSGFGENNKFGVFPSASVGWVVSDEAFFDNATDVMDLFKLRFSYGSSGNRTIGRYQTLARVEGGFRYVDAQGNSIYTQDITGLASPNLAWETTTGINVGLDFGFLDSRINGSFNYYNNNTTNLLYTVHLPRIGRFEEFPDNLGKIHNHGLELNLSSTNIKTEDFTWTTDFAFSRNRDELKELLGVDSDGDGIEDDLVSEGLFIGEPLNTIFDYEITGEFYQLGDEIPSGYDVGTNIIVDQVPGDGGINPETDRVILGYSDPSYRFSIGNNFQYKNWNLNVFVNSIQGGKDFYMQENDLHVFQYDDAFNATYPVGYDNYWLPENPDAQYQHRSNAQPNNFRGKNFQQRSFIRLQNVSLSYRFGEDLLNFLNVDNLNLFVSGRNLITITDWEGWDPETGQGLTRSGSPVLESYTLGLNVQF